MKDNEKMIEGLFKSIDSKNTKEFVSFLSDDASFRMGDAPAVVGKENISSAVDQFFQSIKSLSHNVENTIIDGSKIVTPGTVTYTRHDDSTLTLNFCNIYNVENEKFNKYDVYIDLSGLYK